MIERIFAGNRRTKAVGLASSVLLSAVGLFFYIDARSAITHQEQWLPVSPTPLVQRLGLAGRIQPGMSLTISAPFDGTLLDKPVVQGQQVERGQVLLRLDTAQLQIQLREAQAELLKARRAVQDLQGWASGQDMARARRALSTGQLNLNDTQRKLEETRVLHERGIVPRMELDALQQQVQMQRLDVKAAQAELKEVEDKGRGENRQIADMQLANATAKHQALQALEGQREVKAPFAGIVVSLPGNSSDTHARPVQQGARVSQGQSLMGLANLEQLKVVAKVDESDINQLRAGLPVDITGSGFDGVLLNGNVTTVGSQVLQSEFEGSGASYELSVALPTLTAAQQQHIRLGMSARLSIITYQNPKALIVPHDAIDEQQGQHFVNFRRTPETHGRRVSVSLGQSTTEGVEVFGLFPGFVRTDKAN
ncbi:efflux RND transporter periplasmic adaptor subunit [Pseudomonas sp. NA-150]|uniref:efflux RND transporter periplasmic adaptor subunit n=1 Tax=Pseudomonas sp. NA-150 TaxID=3367525 RepID=UPI0037C91B85